MEFESRFNLNIDTCLAATSNQVGKSVLCFFLDILYLKKIQEWREEVKSRKFEKGTFLAVTHTVGWSTFLTLVVGLFHVIANCLFFH